MKSVAIIQARMGSSRLPGKVLAEISGRPMLDILLDRVLEADEIDETVVATTTTRLDDAIAALVSARDDTSLFRGSETDVLARFWEAAKQHGASIILRITADNPLFDPPTADALIRKVRGGCDFATNNLNPSYPYGIDLEVFTMKALTVAHTEAQEPDEREHVTPYIRGREDRFKLCGLELDRDWSHIRLTVDTAEDLDRIRDVFHRYGPGVRYQDLLSDA